MNECIKTKCWAIISFAGLLACLIFSLWFILNPVIVCYLPSGRNLFLWPFKPAVIIRVSLIMIGVFLGVASYVISCFALRKYEEHRRDALSSFVHLMRPTCLLPISAVVILAADKMPWGAVANAILFVPITVISLIIIQIYQGTYQKSAEKVSPYIIPLVLWLVATIGYSLLGYHVTLTVGEHSGDEGHYIIQAKSLYYDRDLDIKNNLEEIVDFNKGANLHELRHYLHIAPNSSDGHWYSWHPWGLPLIMAPFWGGGLVLRHILLGMMGGFGCLGIFLLCRRVGASISASLISVLLFGTSVYWALHTARFLPEVLGATLFVWIFWAISIQRDKPWMTTILTALFCTYLLTVHVRFLPLSLMGIGFYGLFALCSTQKWSSKIIRLTIFTFLCLAGYIIYFLIQKRMYSGDISGYGSPKVLFSYPLGAWGIIAGTRGAVSIFPLFIWMAAAQIVWVIADKKNRLLSISLLVTFLVCLFTSCTTTYYVGGSCLPGRYLLAVVPLFLPAGALMLDRSTLIARWWFIFLGLLSVALCILTVVFLPVLGREFVHPLHNLSINVACLYGIFDPYCSFLYETPPFSRLYTTVFMILCFVGTLAVIILPHKHKMLAFLLIILIVVSGGACHLFQSEQRPKYRTKKQLACILSSLDLDRIYVSGDIEQSTSLFSISKYVFPGVKNKLSVTTKNLGVRCKNGVLSQPRLEDNDWAGRGYRWTTLTRPFKPTHGNKILHISGYLSGNATPVFALREGSTTLYEGQIESKDNQIDSNYAFYCHGNRGHLYILLRLEGGESTFHLKELYWSPYSEKFLQQANLRLPEEAIQSRP